MRDEVNNDHAREPHVMSSVTNDCFPLTWLHNFLPISRGSKTFAQRAGPITVAQFSPLEICRTQ